MGAFDPTYLAALTTKSERTGGEKTKKPAKSHELAAMHTETPKKPVVQPPVKPPQTDIERNKIDVGDWSKVQTLHKDGTVRLWGEDTLVNQHNPNVLPKQMLPPPSNVNQDNKKKDYWEGDPTTGHLRYHQD